MGSGLLAICGGELAELGDGGGDNRKSEVDVRGGGVTAKTETEAGAGFFRRQADGGKDVRWLNGAGGAGGPRRTGKTFQVKSNQERFAFNAGKEKIGGVGGARSLTAVDA